MKIELKVPKYIKKIQEKLLENGYECYFVGGCIRDTLLGLKVNDYDISTNCDTITLKNYLASIILLIIMVRSITQLHFILKVIM